MSDDKGRNARTEIIHGDDLDYPLDVPDRDQAATTAFPVAGAGYPVDETAAAPKRSGVDPMAPLPFGGDHTARPEVVGAHPTEVSRRGTTDLGLFVLRAVVGVLLVLRGLQKLFGLFDGPGVEGFARVLTDTGFRYGEVLSVVGGVLELVAGAALVLGLLTPVAAAALLGVVGVGLAVQLAQPGTPAILDGPAQGLETTILYLGALVALLFTGPGRWSLDRRWRWSHRPRVSGFLWLVVGVVAAVLVWYVLNGSNPLTSPGNSAPVPAG